MGRIGKTTATHKKEGTYNSTRHGKGGLPVEIPDMPGDMGPKAESCWKIVSQLAFSAGNLAAVDGKALRLLCEMDEFRLDALDDVREKGQTIQGKLHTVKNPSVTIYFGAWDREVDMLRQFGMTPISRRGLDFVSEPDEDETVARILKLKQA